MSVGSQGTSTVLMWVFVDGYFGIYKNMITYGEFSAKLMVPEPGVVMTQEMATSMAERACAGEIIEVECP